jgi:hypothetical protein
VKNKAGGVGRPAWRKTRRADLGLALAAILFVGGALVLRERHDAPAIAPIPPEAQVLADATPIDASHLRRLPDHAQDLMRAGAVSVSDKGLWITSSAALKGCAHPVVMVTPVRGLAAKLAAPPVDGVAVLSTEVGAGPAPIADHALTRGALAFAIGYPRQAPGEIALKRMGEAGGFDLYAEDGRTDGLGLGGAAALSTLPGSGLFDEAGRLAGLAVSDEARRGRLRAAPLAAIRRALAAAGLNASQPGALGRVVTLDNYGVVADELRRLATAAALSCPAG